MASDRWEENAGSNPEGAASIERNAKLRAWHRKKKDRDEEKRKAFELLKARAGQSGGASRGW